MLITTVIATFNRKDKVFCAIDSTLLNFQKSQIVVVDDASTDNTVESLHQRYRTEICQGQITIIKLEQNLGVAGARNAGYRQADGEWVIFLDSDDQYIYGTGSAVSNILCSSADAPLVFFRCQDQNGEFVGDLKDQERILPLMEYLENGSYGEVLTAVNKKLIEGDNLFEETLKGYEGLICCRLIKKYGPAVLSRQVARVYDQSGNDRLSVRQGFYKRMPLLAKGHLLMIKEFGKHMKTRRLISYLAKAAVYAAMGFVYKHLEK